MRATSVCTHPWRLKCIGTDSHPHKRQRPLPAVKSYSDAPNNSDTLARMSLTSGHCTGLLFHGQTLKPFFPRDRSCPGPPCTHVEDPDHRRPAGRTCPSRPYLPFLPRPPCRPHPAATSRRPGISFATPLVTPQSPSSPAKSPQKRSLPSPIGALCLFSVLVSSPRTLQGRSSPFLHLHTWSRSSEA